MMTRIHGYLFKQQIKVIVAILTVISAGDCNIICNNGESVCGYRCYSPQIQQCLHQQYQGIPVVNSFIICGKDQQLCASICYNPSNQQCLQQQYQGKPVVNSFIICGKDQQLCGARCYTPGSQNCRN
ncbi:unnamed protein product [Rotaria socialis]|uniref:Uncharacterized protein n=1 Tax=Rotaria socialis TaxID=392032 RepID=A0A821G7S8_9BILA|nr:unnamed protein product [Rotaria socialis]CAF3512988.1 unnamed protein product [Rotaria socialis]CAF4664565.1 unnamed protein product [Rotaria socialis]CAF4741956.1 unnamed protein product [Rotaria socialis]